MPSPAAGSSLWLKPDAGVLDASGNPCTNLTSLKTWQDQSGNGNDAVQATAGLRPTFIAAGINGLPLVRFTGTLRSPLVLPQPFTLFIVVADKNPVSNFGVQVASDANAAAVGWGSDNGLFEFGSTGFAKFPTRDQLFHLETFTAAGGTGEMFFNGVSLGTGATNCAWSGINLATNAAGTFFSEDFAELIAYPSVLSGSPLVTTTGYLLSKYFPSLRGPRRILAGGSFGTGIYSGSRL